MPTIGAGVIARFGEVNLLGYRSLSSGGTDWSPAMTQALADAAAAGYRRIVIPDTGVDYKFSAAITLPVGVELVGLGFPGLDFSPAGNIKAITVQTNGRVASVYLKGNGKANTATGLNFSGDHVRADRIKVDSFGTGWTGINNNTYITTVSHGQITNCGIGIDCRLSGTGFTAGEKIRFEDCTIANCGQALQASGSFLDMYFEGCSIDYNTDVGQTDNGQYFFNNCHFETNSTTTTQGYLFKKINGATVKFHNIHFGMVGIPYVIDPATEGSSGSVIYKSCVANFTPFGSGTSQIVQSEFQAFTASGGTTTTFDVPFISRTVLASVSIALHSANPARSLTTPTVSFTNTTGTVTYGSAVPSNTNCIVRFG